MPELPDVEVLRNYCHQNILDRKIDSINAKNNRVMKSNPATLRKHLEGQKFRQTGRHGKYLFLATDTRELVLYFGMTGSVKSWLMNQKKLAIKIFDCCPGSQPSQNFL